jgi:hypothetical protein
MSHHLRQKLSHCSFRPSDHCTRTAVLLALFTSVAFTTETRALRGRVTDEQGHALIGAIVQLQNNSTLWIRSYITQSNGLYHFEDLSSSDSYQVQAKYKGISSQTKVLSRFRSRTLATVHIG